MTNIEGDASKILFSTKLETMETIIAPQPKQLASYHQKLLDLAKSFSSKEASCQQLGHLLLGKSFEEGLTKGGISELNNDGSALQLCLSSSTKGIRFRMIADPAAGVFDAPQRLKASLQCVDQTLHQTNTIGLKPMCRELIELLLSKNINLNAFDRGFCWMGASPDQKGLALYLDTRPFGAKGGWDLIREWLEMVLPDFGPAHEVIEQLRPYAVPASFGFEGVNPQAGRAKFYWRFHQTIPFSKLQIAPLASPEIAHFLRQIIHQQKMNHSGMVISAGFEFKTGALEDIKVDLCGHCLPRSSQTWKAQIQQLTKDFNLPAFPLQKAFENSVAEVAFLGMGMDVKGSPRMNLYLKPHWAPVQNQQEQNLQPAIQQALQLASQYLLKIQSPEGAWTDYFLPVGHAVEWVTAYTGLALADLTKEAESSEVDTAIQKAAHFLTTQRAYPEGWGYNARTGPDADSTGFALRLLKAEASATDQQHLLSYWKSEGGFCTYHQTDHWGDVHPCVTAAAALSFSKEQLASWRPQLIDYLKKVAPENGEWPSYWWYNHLYSTYQHLCLLDRLGLKEEDLSIQIPTLQLSSKSTAFELALAAGIAHYRQQDTSVFILRLLEMQQIDGRFPGGYNLRVTDPDCDAPWQQLKGTYYKDIAGTITTATTIQILHKINSND